MELSYGQLIRENRHFRNLLWGQFISELGNWFNYLAGLSLIRAITGESSSAAGILLFLRTFPWALLMPFTGTVSDRVSRRQLMIHTDLIRGFLALLFLLVSKPGDIWIAYVGTVLMSVASAFFDGAKNAATPNVAGKDGLLAGTALMFSTRFFLMAVGAALGGLAAEKFGYEAAFIINSVSFFVSAFSIWLIPEEAMREEATFKRKKETFILEMQEGLRYTLVNPFALTILVMNIIWATGGGAINVIFEGFATKVFGHSSGFGPDSILAILLCANGIGLFGGMIIARKTSAYVERKNIAKGFIGWALILHGLIYALSGLMPNVWLMAAVIIVSRVIVGAEYAVQETYFQRSLPDHIRGRISTLDRGAEITTFGLSSLATGYWLEIASPVTLALLAGLLSGSSGLVWLWRVKKVEFELKKASDPAA